MSISTGKRTIQDCEEAAERTLLELRNLGSKELKALQALDIIAPAGFRPVVELLENGRKKRRTASAESWSPETGEIRIYFEPSDSTHEESVPASDAVNPDKVPSSPLTAAPDSDQKVVPLLEALQSAENTPGRMFVAFKWFRDEYLPSTGLSWAQNREESQAVLAKAIQDGWILTGKVPNPKAPLYPTTTIRLNRQKQGTSAPASRFRPVPISGEPLSHTILQDRSTR